MKPEAFYIIRFEEFEYHSDTLRKNREHCWIEVIFVHHETFFEKKWKFWKKLKISKVRSDFDSTLKILLETGLNLKFHANLKKYQNFMMCQWNISCEKIKKLKKVKNIKSSFRLWFCSENLTRNWTKFEISCKFEKIWKTSWCVNEPFFLWKNKIFEKSKKN